MAVAAVVITAKRIQIVIVAAIMAQHIAAAADRTLTRINYLGVRPARPVKT